MSNVVSLDVYRLRRDFAKWGEVDPFSQEYHDISLIIDTMDARTLEIVRDAEIKHISALAVNRLMWLQLTTNIA